MRKHIYLKISLCFLIMMGCGEIESNPEYILTKYLDAVVYGKYVEAYQYISTKDKKIRTLHEYISAESKEDNVYSQILIDSISYEIKELTITDDTAEASVIITIPDVVYLLKESLGIVFKSGIGGKINEKETEKMLAEDFQGMNIPLTVIENKIDLVKEAGGWKVFFDWKNKEKINHNPFTPQ